MATPPMTRVREGPGFRETWYQSPDGADTEYTREEATPAYCEYIRTTRHRPLHRRYATPTRLSSPPPRSPTATPSPAVGRESCSRLKLEFDSPGAGPNGVGTGVREAGHSPRGRDAAGAGAIGAATSALPVSGGPPGVEGPTPGVSAQSHAAAAPLDTTADSRTQTEVDLLCPGLPSSATTRVRPDVAERLLARATAALQRSRARAAEAEECPLRTDVVCAASPIHPPPTAGPFVPGAAGGPPCSSPAYHSAADARMAVQKAQLELDAAVHHLTSQVQHLQDAAGPPPPRTAQSEHEPWAPPQYGTPEAGPRRAVWGLTDASEGPSGAAPSTSGAGPGSPGAGLGQYSVVEALDIVRISSGFAPTPTPAAGPRGTSRAPPRSASPAPGRTDPLALRDARADDLGLWAAGAQAAAERALADARQYMDGLRAGADASPWGTRGRAAAVRGAADGARPPPFHGDPWTPERQRPRTVPVFAPVQSLLHAP